MNQKQHYVNPLFKVILGRLQAAFLKSGSTTEFYELLDVPKNASPETIRSNYRQKALMYHPDKIQQRYHRPPNDEEKEMNLKIKEAYTVLSDPEKRKLYNDLGTGGYKFLETPERLGTPEGQKAIIENFQNSKGDKYAALTMIFVIIMAFVLQPILICLKIDGDTDASWTNLCIPLWIFDLVVLVDGIGSLCMPNSTEVDDDGNTPDPITFAERVESACMLFLYILFVAFQILLVGKMDGRLSLDWYVVFLPWILWEICRIIWLVKSSCIDTIEYPDLVGDDKEGNGHAGGGDEEDGEGFHPEINNQLNLEKLMKYYTELLDQDKQKRMITICFLRLWFALFLAAKLNGSIDWNWGLVMFPVWLFLLLENCFACYFQSLGSAMSEGIDQENMQVNPNVEDHAKIFYSTNMSGSCIQICCTQCVGCLFFILLVCALQVTSISSFLIVLPFWPLAWILLLLFFCFFCAVGCVDTSSLEAEGSTESNEKAAGAAAQSAGNATGGASSTAQGSYVPPSVSTAEPPTVFIPPAPASEPEEMLSSSSSKSPLMESPVLPPPPVSATTRGSEID